VHKFPFERHANISPGDFPFAPRKMTTDESGRCAPKQAHLAIRLAHRHGIPLPWFTNPLQTRSKLDAKTSRTLITGCGKIRSGPVLVAQALLPVWFSLELTRAHRQECLCYTTFFAASSACAGLVFARLKPAQAETYATKS